MYKIVPIFKIILKIHQSDVPTLILQAKKYTTKLYFAAYKPDCQTQIELQVFLSSIGAMSETRTCIESLICCLSHKQLHAYVMLLYLTWCHF